MDSSSEGSFAWTDASDNSTDNENMAKTNHNITQSGEESESGKTYKKKLQQQLFSGGEDKEACLENTEDVKPKKRTLSPHSVYNKNPKNKRVKAEPESDADITKKKNKKSLQLNSPSNSSNDLYEESFLNSKVKSEHSFAFPSPVKVKKNKKKSLFSENNTSIMNGDLEESLSHSHVSNSHNIIEDSSSPVLSKTEEEDKYNVTRAKKNKKKLSKKSISLKVDDVQNGIQEDSLQADETTTNIGQHVSICMDELSDEPDSTQTHVKHDQITTKQKIKNKQDTISNSKADQNQTSVQINSDSLFAKRKTRMSERIQYEEEDDSDVQTKNNSISIKSTDSKKITSFIKESSISLRPLHVKLPRALILTDDDDVWLIKCPKDVKLEAFQDKRWVLDSKCKIKLDGQPYEGDIGNTQSNMTVLSSVKNRAVIKNVTINGCIRLRRRLPKVHIQEDNIIVNNQTNFIPLPDTKCRHPLFGLNYKKAMKLPSVVAERLRGTRAAAFAGNKNKRRDRRKPECEQLESPCVLKMEHDGAQEELTQSMITSKKKKKKRKHSGAAEDESAPQAKRTKANLEYTELWDSEKAIEDNLFNF